MLAVAGGGAAFLLVRGQEARWARLHPSTGTPVAVWTASSDLPRGTTLTDAMIVQRSMPSAFLPPGSFRSTDAITGRVLSADVVAGEVLTRARVAAADVGPIAALVPPGLRAVVVPSGVPPGTIRAGDRVDVLATYGGGRAYTETVATSLEVIRVLTSTGTAPGTAGSVAGVTSSPGPNLVVLVGPDLAERIAFARAFGQISVDVAGPEPVTETPS